MPRGFRLITGPPAGVTMHLNRLLVRLAVHRPVRWLACGHFFDLQRLIYAVALRAGENYYSVLENNIMICRAETCYQVVALLCKNKGDETPIFISDLLVQFYDEKIREDEATELFISAMQALKMLGGEVPVVVGASGNAERPGLFETLSQRADRITEIRRDAYGA